MTELANQMVMARDSDQLDLIDDCIDTVPAIYDGTAPNCWTTCPPAERTFHLDVARNDQLTNIQDDVWWRTTLPVTYVTDDGIIDVTEYWSIRQVDDRFTVDEFEIQTPIMQRQSATDILTVYFAHIDNENWAQAADLLTQASSAPFGDRLDLQQLGANSYDQGDIADALARWCADGCDTTPPSAAELTFTGGYELTRNAQTIRVTWYEGAYGIYGPPLR
ncbi:hypothetical protein BDK89_0342 [Ilumatobacter fluminis]|uniref:Uncharacterized protein n=2 Tax=Ilumatobacter fluminis TaxID=467091 RepID=A0A4R7HX64_9ACTN|nr:hypothetical protein BDK89_0342 [Ilumatobacter fluminis]